MVQSLGEETSNKAEPVHLLALKTRTVIQIMFVKKQNVWYMGLLGWGYLSSVWYVGLVQ